MLEIEFEELVPSKTEWIRQAVQIRAFEQSLLEAYGKGGIRGTVHTSLGQELIAVICCDSLLETDIVFGTHRSHAYFLAISKDFQGLAREIYGKEGAISKGIGGSQHIKYDNLITNGIQGGMTPIAVGASFDSHSEFGIKSRSICIVGDGTFGSGVLYEALNVASLHQTNTVFIVENNGIAQSTPQNQFLSGSIQARCEAFQIPYYTIDANNLSDLFFKFPEILNDYFSGPKLIDISCSRLGPHSKGDDNRTDEHLSTLRKADLINRILQQDESMKNYFDDSLAKFRDMMDKTRLERDIQEVPVNHVSSLNIIDSSYASTAKSLTSNLRELTAVRIENVFSKFPSARLLGEDVQPYSFSSSKPYSGAFGVSKNISEASREKLLNFPISEAALTGFGIGRALRGIPTMLEIMFADFSTLIIDQIIQQASKIPSMYGEFVPLPILIRLPTGGRRGYGPTHSQNLEYLFFGIPNIALYVSSSIDRSESIYADLLSVGLPVIAVEPKDLYARTFTGNEMLGYKLASSPMNVSKPFFFLPEIQPFGTVFTYGSAFDIARDAFNELLIEREMVFDIFLARLLNPIDLTDIVTSLKRTQLLIIIEEAISSQGFCSFLISQLTPMLDVPFRVVLIGGNGIIGASEFSEHYALLSRELILETIERITKS